ncbi:MAG TPA: shikimate dehydrogenase [Phenylobacterium sp.]|uniref:shikimate dehydrogenase n=1 Tax=Phenylobacterium sp. TaxID=1871053 RepID=UPI002CA1F8E8|nr:shikimate dehydrogenase [Phenylobacterium sp.]HSV02226.1 shikimate dehydrogenase [Phenylobacterium sp.]
MSRRITGATIVAGVAGQPVRHSLSPLIHNAWLDAAGIDGAYVPFAPPADAFQKFAEGLRGGAVRGLNITLPFKEAALSVADRSTGRADAAEAANLLIFEPEGEIIADNTDGVGLLAAFAAQAPAFQPTAGPVVILGAGGAARGAAAALKAAGAPQIRIVNRTLAKAEFVAGALGTAAFAYSLDQARRALEGATAVINATSAGISNGGRLEIPLWSTPKEAVVMDMIYTPLLTEFLQEARALGRQTVDGLGMLVGQARPSFEAFYGRAPPDDVDVRALAVEALEARR